MLLHLKRERENLSYVAGQWTADRSIRWYHLSKIPWFTSSTDIGRNRQWLWKWHLAHTQWRLCNWWEDIQLSPPWCVPPFSVWSEVCNVGSTYRSAASTMLWGPLVGCTQSPHISTESWQFTFWSSNPTICWNSARQRTFIKILVQILRFDLRQSASWTGAWMWKVPAYTKDNSQIILNHFLPVLPPVLTSLWWHQHG